MLMLHSEILKRIGYKSNTIPLLPICIYANLFIGRNSFVNTEMCANIDGPNLMKRVVIPRGIE